MLPEQLKPLYGSHLKVLMYAMQQTDLHGACELNRRRIGRAVGLDRSGINRTLRQLEAVRLVRVDWADGVIYVTAPFRIIIEAHTNTRPVGTAAQHSERDTGSRHDLTSG